MTSTSRTKRRSKKADQRLDHDLHALFAGVFGADPILDPDYRAELVRRLGKRRVLEAMAGSRVAIDDDRLAELLGGWALVADVVQVVGRDYFERLRSARATR